jgi:hypothetical protein
VGINSAMPYRYILFLLLILIVGCKSTKEITVASLPNTTVEVKQDTITKMAPVVVVKDSVNLSYTIGLVLPLQLIENFVEDSTSDADPQIIPQSIQALQFYEGCLLAQESFNEKSIDVKFKIYDSGIDSAQTLKLLKAENFDGCDAVVAMMSNSFYTALGKASRGAGIPFFILQSSNTQVLDSFSGFWLSTPSNITQLRMMSTFLIEKFPSSNFIALSRDQRKENDLAKYMAEQVDTLAKQKGTCSIVNFTKTGGWAALQAKLSKQKRNVLIIPTGDESYLSSLINKLDELKEEYSILLAGLPSWENFESVDPKRLEKYNTHIFNTTFLDFESAKLKSYRKNFIDIYHADPLLQAYQSNDIVNFIVSNIHNHNSRFDKYKSEPNFLNTKRGFDFEKKCSSCGFENRSLNILKYSNYKLVKVN